MTNPRIPTPETSLGDPAKRQYHHGNLRQTLLEATVQLIESQGLDQVSLRALAKLVGVSSAAPFRHFPSRTALLAAVAEQAMDRLRAEIDTGLAAVAGENALRRYRALGIGFFAWVFSNPVHFQVISTRAVIDFDGSSLRARNDAIRSLMVDMMREAQAAGLLRPGDPERYAVAGRALGYGLARMYVDGQFPSWGLEDANPLQEVIAIFDQFLASITA